MPRAHKGDRDIMVTRMPRELGDLVRLQAAAGGVPLSEFIASALAAQVGRLDLAPPPRLDEELPMTG